MSLPALLLPEEIKRRLVEIFPEGSQNRTYCVREMSAHTVFAMLYIGAVEGADQYLGPKHVYRMTDEQSRLGSDAERLSYAEACLKPGFEAPGKRWYRDNTREPIRDETLREGLERVGAVASRRDIPTTSSKPRYALVEDFAALFIPELSPAQLAAAITVWQEKHLSQGALARVQLQRAGVAAGAAKEGVLVTFPNGETRRLSAGPSSVITQAVVESFAKIFLENPAVVWLSESGNKVIQRDEGLTAQLGLDIRPDRDLPDVILADVGGTSGTLLVFVEVVATDGPIHPRRQEALLEIAAAFPSESVAFVTAYQDRGAPAFRKTVAELAWGRSFAWFANEPHQIMGLHDTTSSPVNLRALLRLK